MTDSPFDPGLQPERTLLAWRRTALSLAVASAIGMRLTITDFGGLAIFVGTVGIVLSVAAYIGADARYRRAHRTLTESASLSIGGTSLTAVALSSILLAGLALAWLVVT